MRYVRLQMLNGQLELCSGEFKHLQVMRKKFPLSIRGLHNSDIYNLTILPDAVISERILIGQVQSGYSCFWVPLFDKSRMEWAVEKLTELGVAGIVFYYSDHCTYNQQQIEKMMQPEKLERMQNKIWAAAQQSGNFSPPAILGVFSLKELQNPHYNGRTWAWSVHAEQVLHPQELRYSNSNEDTHREANLMDDCLFHFVIGPEGDFSVDERELLNNVKWGRLNQKMILRTETALITVAAQLGQQWWPTVQIIDGG